MRSVIRDPKWTAAPPTQCRSNPVSGHGLPKTGIFQISARDYRSLRSGNAQIRSLETRRQFTKARHWRAFSALSKRKSRLGGLPGWRRSADRTRLHANSLLTGNFTGKFAILGRSETISLAKTAVPQALLERFPMRINRENIAKNQGPHWR